MERRRGAKPNCRVIRREIHAEFLDVHACQYRLTSLICQPKLTQPSARGSCCASTGTSGTACLVRQGRLCALLALPSYHRSRRATEDAEVSASESMQDESPLA